MSTNARAAYLDASIATASPARLLVMLVDRMVLDVRRGLAALQGGEHPEAHRQLTHAQEIVLELAASLKADAFEGGTQLAGLYDFLHRRLVEANVRKDADTAAECLGLADGIAETWRRAALLSATSRSA